MKKICLVLILLLSLYTCSNNNQVDETNVEETIEQVSQDNNNEVISKDDIEISESLSNKNDGEHVITADNNEVSYSNVSVYKTGDSSGDEADFYGENAAVFATNGAVLNLNEIVVETSGTHANGVFSYGENTVVNISDSYIETSGNCSGGIMTTGSGTLNASNLYIHTTGDSSAPIRSDRGGGIVNVDGGKYISEGKGSPVVYSTADITVNDAYMESKSAQGIVVEGQNSVSLDNVELIADNVSKNSDKSDYYQAVMIYQSMSGDADEGMASYTMNNSSLTNNNGDIFFVNNTVATINLSNNKIINNDSNGILLRAQAVGWGNEGSNGGHVTMNLDNQETEGDIYVDDVSTLNLYIKNNSDYTGSISNDGQVYVELDENSTWTLTGDSYVSALTCDEDSIDLNGYKLYVDGKEYVENTQSSGEAIVVTITNTGNFKPDGKPGERPDGKPGDRPEGGPKRP